MLCYFQGFHDICQVFLLVLGVEAAVVAMEHIALLRIRDFMLPSLGPALDHLHLLYPLLQSADKKLCEHLSRTKPFFALAATLTLYAHDIQEYSNIARLFDVLLATDPVFPLYLFAQVCIPLYQTCLMLTFTRLCCSGAMSFLKFPMKSRKCCIQFSQNYQSH